MRSLLVTAALFIPLLPAAAQQRPTPAQALELLRTRPDLQRMLQQRIRTSGLTPDQVRARLRAEGYPESLLDAYLPGSPANTGVIPSENVLDAVRELGMAEAAELDSLRAAAGPGALEAPRAGPFGDPSGAVEGDDGTAPPSRDPAADSGGAIFGLDVFRRGTTQFEANLAGPVDANYRLGPGDRLVLILTGDVELAYTLDVTREGFVVIPQVGRVDVANLSLAQLDDVLYAKLGRVYSGVRRGGGTTRFSVSVARLRSNQVFVVGDVGRPGSYRVSSAGTALTALYAAGGTTDNGSLRRIAIRRGGRAADTLDVYDYLLLGDASHDARLENGDVVFVPVHGPRVRIYGEVTRPATYELREGETLADAIRMAGGFTPTAARRRVQIERIVPAAQRVESGRDRVVLDVASDEFAEGTGPALPLQAGDVVRVFPVANRVRNRIVVSGSVWTPGSQGYRPGMRLSEALRGAGGLKPDTYLGQVLIARLKSDSTRVQLRAQLRDTSGAAFDDVALQEDDEIRVFSVTEFRPERYVAISGAVRDGGRFPYREGMTMRDLVLLAGGLEESAYLGEAEIARLPENRADGVTARTFRVPLDSSYLFERGADGRYVGPLALALSNGKMPDAQLEPYDNVLILRQPDFELQRTVWIGGEVRFPGRYALVRKTERLSDIIARAGGLTSEAYPDGAVFYRQRNRIGRIGLDLPEVLRDADARDNLLLQDGDSITLPRYSGVVTVTGAVNSPVTLAYVPGRDIDFYVHSAGGPAVSADLGRAYVTQPNGKVESVRRRPFLPDGSPQPKAGSTVFVPEKSPAAGANFQAIALTTAQVLAALVSVLILARQ
ncbi:MAG TPA: SLBB domain-containing protein [Gemmatimonadaceae bacterium]|nr:SLBB domain-containing protein [Gemmatimonadaceae bacterium]